MIFLKKLFRILPQSIASFPYHISYKAAQIFHTTPYVQIWARNSYTLGQLCPGLSDIDLTFLFSPYAKNQDIKKTIEKNKRLRLFFPLWGEINSYKEDEILFFLSLLNPLEKQRDPKLSLLYHQSSRLPSQEERFVFMLRMLKADNKNLSIRPEQREKKWRFHCRQVQIPYSIQPSESVIENLLCPLNLNIDESILKKFLQIDETSLGQVDQFYLPLDEIERRAFILLFPLRWLVVSLRNNQFEVDKKIIEAFQHHERELLYAHLNWEIWGIFSQYHELALTWNIDQHLKNVGDIISSFQDDPALKLKEAIKHLQSIIKTYKQE